MIQQIVISTSVIFILGLSLYLIFKKRSDQCLKLKLLLIKIPKKEEGEKPDLAAEINLSEQLLATLSALEEPFVFEMAVHSTGEPIHFYLAVSRNSLEFATRQVQGIFHEAQVEEVSDYTIFEKESKSAGAYLSLGEREILPLQTYLEAKADTFAPILSTFSKLKGEGEGACLQLVFRPAPKQLVKIVSGSIDRLKKGEKFKDILKNSIFRPGLKEKEDGRAVIVDDEAVKLLQAKISRPLFSVNLRIVVGAESKEKAEDILTSMSGSFGQFAMPLRNSVKMIKPKNLKKFLVDYAFRRFDERLAVNLNTTEISGLFHLPTYSTNIPRILWLKTREAPPPQNLPSEGVIMGESVFRGERKTVRMKDDDRRRHLYVIGQTGTGKSKLQQNMIVQDMRNGKGLCVIDPHGDLIDDVLGLVPLERIDDVIVFNPADTTRPVGLNMLEYNLANPEEKTFIVNEMQSIFNRLFVGSAESLGPQFQQYMRNTLLLLMEDAKNEACTLMEISRVFTDEAFRKRKLARITNPAVLDFWQKEATKTSGEQSLANFTPYITSKFGNFTANDYIRPIIGQTKSAFNFRKVMDEGKILLVNLAKGKIGDINAGLLGMVITGRLLMAALSRVDIVEAEKRRDFYFYIDEFQNFTTDSIAIILSEARKYRLSLILAHQFIGQLTDEIRKAVFGNVGSMAVFRIGVPDQEVLVKSFAPEFSERDLLNIDNQNALAKLLIDGQPSKPFNFKTFQFEKGSAEVREKLKELSRLTYGRDLEDVEREIFDRLRS